ncbi:valine--tRNA ligase [Mycoplasmopsis agassizii]|uniref:Valine--tRNA ligase n=1 Tax=Mycoplasmopsis agassizii TaxID=33922 RepID=A0ABX4H462_9BACT|nr:valine--tRNA ligase [Mycoplasmopsis agassizii]PAF54684.1 valine--tRNA ligase [Mycoplasmopsis agassizii]SMC16052.1 valyl-tRNA synthetase [Mycoplasmopsis agassizii]
METKFNHALVEANRNQKWVDKRFFSNHDLRKKPYSIILPPPNVTGNLHIGHALNNYLQDTVIRYKKLTDHDVFWVAATDHAGIATQVRVEQEIAKNNQTRYDLGREAFLEKTWEWKHLYANNIHKQWAKLGLALDYENERFTLDAKANEAVNKVFISLYEQGLIYRDYRAINWDVQQKTTLSNMEIVNKNAEQVMYYIKYFLQDSDQFLTVATVRTETLFSDVALAVNSQDKRYQDYLGKFVVQPISKKLIPIIADDFVDIKFGSGVMKVSAHATDDIDIIKKHNLEILECINDDGFMNENAGDFQGLERLEARVKVADYLRKNNLLVKEEKTVSALSYSDRSNSLIEILVKKQWFVKMKPLAKNVLKHLETTDAVKSFPTRFKNVLKQWLNNVNDWAISRQIWWGHQIPAWYKDDEVKVQVESPGENWTRDEDVLDTWFSSALSPFSFLSWPQETKMLERYYPTDLLVTGYDILFFWVTRMYFMGLQFQNKKPFKDVFYHGIVRDEQNRKMSKSLGNGIDPIDVIDKYGSDSLRWFLITNTTAGQDLSVNFEKISAAWNFQNKIWNVARLIKLNFEKDDTVKKQNKFDLWISNKFSKLVKDIEKYIKKYEFTLIGKVIYQFIMEDLSSNYLELTKLNPNANFQFNLLKDLLILIHPFLPFLTDYLFENIYHDELLNHSINKTYKAVKTNVDDIIELVKILRNKRVDLNLTKDEIIYYDLISSNFSKEDFDVINKLCNAKTSENRDENVFFKNYDLYIKLDESIKKKLSEEKQKQINFLNSEIERANKILSNKGFLEKAKPEKIQEEKDKLELYKTQLEKLING